MKKIRFNKAGIDNACNIKGCLCRQGKALADEPKRCECGHVFYQHRLILKNWPKIETELFDTVNDTVFKYWLRKTLSL